MLSHEPEVQRLLHQERTAHMAEDAQHPMSWTSVPTFGVGAAFHRLAQLTHVAVAVRHRRIYSKP